MSVESGLDCAVASTDHKNILGLIPTPVMACDRDFNVIYMNELGEQLLGLAPGTAVGRKCYDLFKTEHCNTAECRCRQAMSVGEPRQGETVASPAPGVSIPIRYNGSPLRDESGAIIGAVEYVLDISGEMALRNALVDLAGEVTRGNLEHRAETKGVEPAYARLLDSLNGVVEAFQAPVDTVTGVLGELAAGDLRVRIEDDFEGSYGVIKNATNELAEKFQGAVTQLNGSAGTMASSSEELSAVSQQMAGSAEEASSQAAGVSAATEQVSMSIQTVSSATEEMTASIQEIAKNASSATEIAHEASQSAERATEQMRELEDASTKIGQVIKLITSVAEQTNLLALNATIEAARAGDAGKGFAVVANEVKELAKQTAEATEDISQRVEGIQRSSKLALGGISEINEVVSRINDIQQTIASAVEEQTSTTAEIARNVSEAANGGNEIARNMETLNQATHGTASGANDTLRAAEDLARMAAELQDLVGAFHI